MKTLEGILLDCTVQYASEVTGDERFYFLLENGRLISHAGLNHSELLGIETEDTDAQKNIFCSENNAVRICFEENWNKGGHLYVEIISIIPNEPQWSALGKLYGKRRDTTVVWDIRSQDGQWSHGEGSLGDLKRKIDPVRTRWPTGKKKPLKRTLR